MENLILKGFSFFLLYSRTSINTDNTLIKSCHKGNGYDAPVNRCSPLPAANASPEGRRQKINQTFICNRLRVLSPAVCIPLLYLVFLVFSSRRPWLAGLSPVNTSRIC